MPKQIKTAFPVSRIKQFMQMDEDVGKIVAAVPVAVSRCLELFLEDLCKKTVEVTKAKHSNTVTPEHLKICVDSHENFDFLKEILEKNNVHDNPFPEYNVEDNVHAKQKRKYAPKKSKNETQTVSEKRRKHSKKEEVEEKSMLKTEEKSEVTHFLKEEQVSLPSISISSFNSKSLKKSAEWDNEEYDG
eukprot:TRINITY_DN5174_c0_g1_i1.p1 TRINITY_DN5174_c0_g1~~TRINITY_DN5174_c0_g1_i1.p1  ORF type:complete len:188 (+),score=67.02 TRINITY_DN5174_c0_g1_i1:196-759(+)